MPTEPLVLKAQDARGVVTLTLNRPQAFNALSEAMIDALQEALNAVAMDLPTPEAKDTDLLHPFKGNFDLTVISHVEPLDFDRYADPTYYFGYDNQAYRDLLARYNEATAADTRTKLLGDLQRQIAKDSVNVFLFQLPQFSVAKAGLKGLWSSSPVFANDLMSVAWR